MGLRITCPDCGKMGVAPDNAVGRKVRCRACQAAFRVEDGTTEYPPMRIVAETHPEAVLEDMSDLSLQVRARQFLEQRAPKDLGDHSMGLALIRTYANGDEDKI